MWTCQLFSFRFHYFRKRYGCPFVDWVWLLSEWNSCQHHGKKQRYWTALNATGSYGPFITVSIPDGTKYYGGYSVLQFITVYHNKLCLITVVVQAPGPAFQYFDALFRVLGNLGSRPQPQKHCQERGIENANVKMSTFLLPVSLFQKKVCLPICGLVLTSFRAKFMPAPW